MKVSEYIRARLTISFGPKKYRQMMLMSILMNFTIAAATVWRHMARSVALTHAKTR
jgi:hypothetical protein